MNSSEATRWQTKYQRLRKAFQRKLNRHRQCQENLLALLENLPSGIFVVNFTGQIVFFNREAEKIIGYERKQILNAHFRTLLSLDDLADGFKLFYEAIRGNYPQSILLRLLKKNRATTVAEVQVAPFRLDEQLDGAIAFVRDISERKRIEEINRKRVESFIQFSKELEEWHQQVLTLKKEVNNLLITLGKKEKYPLLE